jgi:hypothetical protein
MSIKFGSNNANTLRIGASAIDKIYVGSNATYYGLVESIHGDGSQTLKINIDAENPYSYSRGGTIGRFDVSGITSGGSGYFNSSNVGYYKVIGTQGGKTKYQASDESDSTIRYRSSDNKWEFDTDGDGYYISVSTNDDNPWDVTSWENHPDGNGNSDQPVFSNFIGNTINDIQGNHNAILSGGFNDTTPKNWEIDKDAGASVEFINFGDIETFNAITNFTFSLWFEFTSITGDHDIITKGDHSTDSPILVWYDAEVSGLADVGDANTATISFFVKDGSGNSHWVSAPSSSIVAGQVYNLVVQADHNGVSKIWLNGNESVSNTKSTFTGGIANNTEPLKLGAPNTGSNDSDMKIYAFHAYNDTLTEDQITQNWNSLRSRFSSLSA